MLCFGPLMWSLHSPHWHYIFQLAWAEPTSQLYNLLLSLPSDFLVFTLMATMSRLMLRDCKLHSSDLLHRPKISCFSSKRIPSHLGIVWIFLSVLSYIFFSFLVLWLLFTCLFHLWACYCLLSLCRVITFLSMICNIFFRQFLVLASQCEVFHFQI